MLFDLQRREREGWIVLAAVGELDLSAVPRVRAAVQPVLAGSRSPGASLRVVVDLSDCAFLDSAGLGVVLGVIRRVRQAGGTGAVVTGGSDQVTRLLSVLRLEQAILVAADLDEVIERTAAMAAPEEGGADG